MENQKGTYEKQRTYYDQQYTEEVIMTLIAGEWDNDEDLIQIAGGGDPDSSVRMVEGESNKKVVVLKFG